MNAPFQPAPADLAQLSRQAWALRERLDAMKRQRTPHAEEELRQVARAYIQAAYAWQIARHGRIVQRLSAAALLR